MKRFLSLLLAAALTLSLTACDKADSNSGSNPKSSRENYEPIKMIRIGAEAKYDENRS